MSELASGAGAPSTGNATAPTGNAPTGPQSNSATPQPSGSGDGRQRGPDGRFAPTAAEKAAQKGAPPDAAKAEAAKKAAEFRFREKIAVHGREEEVDLSREDLIREIQLARASQAKFKEVAKREREMAEREERLKADPRGVLESGGVDPLEFAKRVLSEHAQRELMSPEERRAYEAEVKLQHYEAERAEREKAEGMRAAQERAAKLWNHIGPQFSQALEAEGLPRDRYTLREISKVGQEFLSYGLALEPRQVVAEVKRRMSGTHDERLASMDARTLLGKLGEPRVRELAQLLVEKFKARQDIKTEAPRVAQPQEPKRREYLDEAELRRSWRGK